TCMHLRIDEREPIQHALGSILGRPAPVGASNSLAYMDGNDRYLYVAGSFDQIGGVDAKNIARFDGVNWSALGSGLDGWAYPITVFGNRIVVGGRFTKAGDRSSYHLAVWHEPGP